MRKRVLIIDSNYPNENNLYGDVFVHARARYYKEKFEIQVLGWDALKDTFEFTYEEILAKSFSNKEHLAESVIQYKPDIVLIHFVEGWMLNGFIKKINCPVLIWVHGIEALGWYRRLFNYKNIKQFSFYILYNIKQMFSFHKLVSYSNDTKKVFFVFVSNWMKKISQTDSQKTINNFYIIPNPIDSTIFKYSKKSEEDRKKILLIRSFDSKKYANDIAIDAILILSKKDFFPFLKFDIYGKGKYFKPLSLKVKHLPNVVFHNYFLENKEIPKVHAGFGIFLCPTRQDAQGVSMCEAMSSGLVPISSFNTAIPEFLKEGETGFMTQSANEIANKIEYLYLNPNKFLEISEAASLEIGRIAGHNLIMERELEVISNHINIFQENKN